MSIKLPNPVMVVRDEGGEWEPFGKRQRTVHAIMFADGSVFDTVNGWRPLKKCISCMGTGYADVKAREDD